MALKIFAVALMLFLAEVVFLTTKDFKDIKSDKKDIDFTDIEFTDLTGYLISENGYEAKLKAKSLLKYKHHVEAFNIQSEFIKEGKTDYINANKAILKDDTIKLLNNVKYKNNSNMLVNSDNLVYNTKNKVIKIDSPFNLFMKNKNIKGNHLVYDKRLGTIKAKDITCVCENKED